MSCDPAGRVTGAARPDGLRRRVRLGSFGGAGWDWPRRAPATSGGGPGNRAGQERGGPALFARQIVLQIALQDIGQLTDI
jgi:hypothetical protein